MPAFAFSWCFLVDEELPNEVRLSGGPQARQPHNTGTTSVALTSQYLPKAPGRCRRGLGGLAECSRSLWI